MNKILIIIPIIAVIAGVSIAINALDTSTNEMPSMPDTSDEMPSMPDTSDEMPSMPDTSDEMALEGTIDIGILLPLTGDLASHGEEDKMAALLAVEDFNEYLADKGSQWNLNGIVEDTETKPVATLDKITTLNAKGVNVIVGPAASASVRNSLGYVTANNIILISCCSTAPALAIEGDNIFRTVPDDNNQGPAISNLVQSQGIEVLVPVWRADTWGDGLRDATVRAFEKAGGIVDEGIRYNPEAPDFSASMSLLASNVQKHVDEHGHDKVGIILISFAEVLQIMQQAHAHDILDEVRWFGSDANTAEQRVVEDPVGLEFANAVDFTTVQFAAAENPVTDRVRDYIRDEIGRTPSVYAYTSYDAVWLAGLAMEAAQSTDADMIKEQIIPVSLTHNGAVGSTALNPAGDLDSSDYAVWAIRDNMWTVLDPHMLQ